MLLVWQYVFEAEKFMTMRGILMIVVMKITSLSFDLASEKHVNIPLLHLCSYLLDGSTVIFGPWITYKQYKESLILKEYKVS
ncbi:unnamed protein product [Gongylonema pulchrum]|uniref:Secreted protein n=1 Tax=Gongylonema pulchrum TaxID=637853 RepID=A0A183DLX3_9BILA|nr:unnamed protein product [Gongylonema pulchrum]